MLSCVGRGLCDELITSPEESYRVSNSVWLRNLKGGQGPIWAVEPLDASIVVYLGLYLTDQVRFCRSKQVTLYLLDNGILFNINYINITV
jgi:hypothetical protein